MSIQPGQDLGLNGHLGPYRNEDRSLFASARTPAESFDDGFSVTTVEDLVKLLTKPSP